MIAYAGEQGKSPLPAGSGGEDTNRNDELATRFPGAAEKFVHVPTREDCMKKMKDSQRVTSSFYSFFFLQWIYIYILWNHYIERV